MTEGDLLPRRHSSTKNELIARQESSTVDSSTSSDISSSTQDTLASTSNPNPTTVTATPAGSPTPTSPSSPTDLAQTNSTPGSTVTSDRDTGAPSVVVATASQATDVTTGAVSSIADSPTSAPTDASASGQQTISPTDGVISNGGTSGVTGGTSGDTSSASDLTTSADGTETISPTTIPTITTISSTTTSLTTTSSPTDVTSTTSDTLSDTSTTSSQTPTSTSSSSQTTQSASSSSSSDSSSSSSTDATSATSTTQQQASTSFTTSFSEIITTVNGAVTTIFSPVPTLNSDTDAGVTASKRTAITAGSAIGGTAFILMCIAIVFCCRRRQKRIKERAHRRLPTPRSMLLAGEDDFDLAGPSSKPSGIRRGLGILGSLARGGRNTSTRGSSSNSNAHLNVGNNYMSVEEGSSTPVMSIHDGGPHASLAALSADTPENRALDGAPPRLLRPRTSGSGSLFEEQVWPPPREGLRDPLMAASSVDLTSIVDEVMGPSRDGLTPTLGSASSAADIAKSARLRGGDTTTAAAETDSLLVEPDVDELGAPNKVRGESDSTRSGHTPDATWHQRDWSIGSHAPLLAHLDGGSSPPSSYPYAHQRNSSGSGSWLPPGAARAAVPGVDSTYSLGGSRSAVNLPMSVSRTSFPAPAMQPSASGSSAHPQPKLWIDRVPRRSIDSKAAAETQLRRLSISNPDEVPASPTTPSKESFPPAPASHESRSPERANTGRTLASSFSLSTSSTQRLKVAQGGDLYGQPAVPDMSEIDPQSPARTLSLGHSVTLPASASVRLVDVDEMPEHEPSEPAVESPAEALDEIPPRYDMIRRDTELSEIRRNIRREEGSQEDVGRAL